MPAYAKGGMAWGECQRCGLRSYLRELTLDGYFPNIRVCEGCYDPPQPQERLAVVSDPVALWKPAPQEILFRAPVLSLVSVSSSAVRLAWTAADFGAYTVGSYAVYRAVAGGPYTLLATFNNSYNIFRDGGPAITQTLAYIDAAVAQGVAYTYYVQANSLGSSPVPAHVIPSNVLQVTTLSQSFVMTAGTQFASHTYNGYCNALVAPFLNVPMGSLTPPNAQIKGLIVDSFFSDTAPNSGPTLCLHGATGAEVFTISFIDENGVLLTLTSASANKTAYAGGFTFSWFNAEAFMFLDPHSYTVNWT